MREGQWPRGVTPRPRSGAAAESARLQWRRNGREELPCVRGQWRPGGATPCPRSGAAGRSHLRRSNDRIISVRLQGKPFNVTVIQVYAPTSNAEETEVERFYEDLQDVVELTPKKMFFSL